MNVIHLRIDNTGKAGFFMETVIRMHAETDSGCLKNIPDGALQLVIENQSESMIEYHAEITNSTDNSMFLKTVTLFQEDHLEHLGIGEAPYTIFRSGRHKNDMPGVFVSGCMDQRMEDVSSVMTEAGDHQDGELTNRVVSDHLTLIQGNTDKILAVEFLTGKDQMFSTVLNLDEHGNLLSIEALVHFNIILKPQEQRRTETIRIALVKDADEEVKRFSRWKAERCGSRNTRHPSVFCTWYYYGLSVTYEDVKTCLNIIRERKLPYEVFQIDEGWEITLGEYEANEKFPLSMKQLADEIRQAGYTPGLWSSPFVAHETASIWKSHPEWILKDQNGAPCLFPMNDQVYFVFDITNPGTYPYFTAMYEKFTQDWGYTYHKLDFTRAAVLYEDADRYDKTITLVQAYVRAVTAIRKGMGKEAFFLMCGGLYDPLIGLVDAQRTGSDVLSMWTSISNKGGKTVPYTVRQNIFRMYMNQWWANDADALMIRKKETMERNLRLTLGLLNDEEIKTSLVNQFASGGIVSQTEPLDRIDDDRLLEIRHVLPVVETCVSPGNILSRERFPSRADVVVTATGAHCIAVINWSDTEEKTVTVNLSDLNLPEGSYAVSDFYAGIYHLDVERDETVTLGTLKPHGATVVKIERMNHQPVIIASDSHYSMGAECKRIAIEHGRLVIEKDAVLPVDSHYTVWLPDGWHHHGETIINVVMHVQETTVEIPLEKAGELHVS